MADNKSFPGKTHPLHDLKSTRQTKKSHKREERMGDIARDKMRTHEEVELDESVDKNHPIVKEYNDLKKHDIKTLRGMIAQSGGVVDTSGFKSKDHAASHIIRSKHGNKKVDAVFGLKEDIDSFADALIKRSKQNLNKDHVVNAARIAGMDDKKLMAAVNKKVGRIKEEVELDETLNVQQRQKRAAIMRRYKSKIERSREIAKGKVAPEANIKKRAYAQARQILRRKLAGPHGAEYEKLGPSEKMAIDRVLDKKGKAIKKLALRLIPRVKKAEYERLQSYMHGQTLVNHGAPEGKISEDFNNLFLEYFGSATPGNSGSTGERTDNPIASDKTNVKSNKKKKNSAIEILGSFSEEADVNSSIFKSLDRKANTAKISLDVIGEVYDRGLNSWCEDYNISQTQYAFARVNSFINKGKTYFNEDADLQESILSFKEKLNEIQMGLSDPLTKHSSHKTDKGTYGVFTSSNNKNRYHIRMTHDQDGNKLSAAEGKRKYFASSMTHDQMSAKLDKLKEEINIEEATTAEKNKQYIEVTHILGQKRRVPVHPSMAFKALNRYRNDPTTKSARIVQGSVTEEIEESNNTPYVKPHIESGETKQTGWKASNKHGNVKYFGLDFKKSAQKHAGISEGTDLDEAEIKGKEDPDRNTKIRTKLQYVERDITPQTPESDAQSPKDPCSSMGKQQRVKKIIVDEQVGNVQPDPKKRLVGTDSLVKAYRKDTPGESLDESFEMAFDYQGKPSLGLTAAELHMQAKGGFAHHTDVQNVMEVTDIKNKIKAMFETTILEEDKDQLSISYNELSDMVQEAYGIIAKIKSSVVERDAWSEAQILKMERYIQSVDAYLDNMAEDVVAADKKGEVVAGHKRISIDPKTGEQITTDVPAHVRNAPTGKKIIKSGNPNDGIPG